MALYNLVVSEPVGRWLRSSRALELVVVVALTVAVVVVAALWGSASQSVGPISLDSLELPSEPSAATTSAVASVTSQVAESERSVSVGSLTPLRESGQVTIPAQTGIVPGQPDPSEPARPDSFERYQVQRGESLFMIASARGVPVSDLARWNWYLDEDSTLIHGEWIWIPLWDTPVGEGESSRGGG